MSTGKRATEPEGQKEKEKKNSKHDKRNTLHQFVKNLTVVLNAELGGVPRG